MVDDSDSQLYINDTDAKRVIVNYPKLSSSLMASIGSLNGIGGNPVQIRGRGKLHISLLSDSGKDSYVTEMDNVVYVPSSPFNIIPPQTLIANLNIKENLVVDYANHDDN